MPIYEYRCRACSRKATLLVGMVAQPDEEVCPNCGSRELDKLVSRFRRLRSEDDRVEEMASRLETTGEPDSPAEMRRMIREMGKAMDEDMSDEMEELFDADMAVPSDSLG